jgi:plastocyanin
MSRTLSFVAAAALAIAALLPDSAFAQRRRFTVPVYYPSVPVYYTYSSYNPIPTPRVYTPPLYYAQPASVELLPTISTSVRPIAAINLRIDDNRFEPQSIRIPPGATVRWVNYGRNVHTVSTSDENWERDSGDLMPGQPFSVTFDKPGTYRYHCHHHPGMEGTIIVGAEPATGTNGTNGRAY